MSAHPDFSSQSFRELSEKLLLPARILRSAAFRCNLGIKVAICAEASAEWDVDIDHGLSEHELRCSEKGLLGVSFYCIDTLHITGDIIEIDAELDLLALIVDLT